MALIYWSSLASGEAFPVPYLSWKLWRALWRIIATARQRFRNYDIVFHKTYTSPIPLKSPPPLSISTAVYHVTSSASRLSRNSICTRSTTFRQLVASGVSILQLSENQSCGCYVRIPEGGGQRNNSPNYLRYIHEKLLAHSHCYFIIIFHLVPFSISMSILSNTLVKSTSKLLVFGDDHYSFLLLVYNSLRGLGSIGKWAV